MQEEGDSSSSFKTIPGFKTVFPCSYLLLIYFFWNAITCPTCLCCFKNSPVSTQSSSKPPGQCQGFFPGIFYSNSCTGLSGLPLPLGLPVLNCHCEHSLTNQNFIKDLRSREKKKLKLNSKTWLTEACLLFNDFKHPQTVTNTAPFPPASSFPSSPFPFGLLGKCSKGRSANKYNSGCS